MVGKDGELGDVDDDGLARVKLIAEKKSQLEQTADQVREEISSCFERLISALRGRERQLLRQVEAVHRQQVALVQSNSELQLPTSASLRVDLNVELELLARIREFGRIDLSNSIAVKDFEPYRPEEYQDASEDMVSFDKSLKMSEQDEHSIDVNSSSGGDVVVTRRKRDIAIASTSRQCDGSLQGTATDSPFVENESDSEDSSDNDENDEAGNFLTTTLAEDKSTHSGIKTTENNDEDGDNNNASSAAVEEAQDKSSKEGLAEEHPIQIQQWLRQILAETETEPIVNEIGRPIVGQFPKMPNPAHRLYREFPVET